MSKRYRVPYILILSAMLSACSYIESVEDVFKKGEKIQKTVTEQKTVTLACNRGNIEDYLEKGWKIINEQKQEVPCTWKTQKANRKCNLEFDKGCRITVPDEIGEEIKYSLERTMKNNDK